MSGIWTEIKEGDRIRIRESRDVPAGTYLVAYTDAELRSGPGAHGIFTRELGLGAYIKNSSVEAIIERDGKPYVDGRPAHERANKGDVVTVRGSLKVSDGDYEVVTVDEGDRARLQVVDGDHEHWWIANEHIVETRQNDRPQPWLLVSEDDRIEISESNGMKAGIYTVRSTDDALYDGPQSLGIELVGHNWIANGALVRIVERDGEPSVDLAQARAAGTALVPSAPRAVPQEPAWQRAKVGDTVRVTPGDDHPAGDFKVTRAKNGNTAHRIAVDYEGRNGGIWWIWNRNVSQILGEDPTAAGVRGEFLIHVDVPTIMANRERNEHRPVALVRRLRAPGEPPLIARELAWDGPTRFVHHEFLRIEGTDIQNWVETDVAVTRWMDGEQLSVLTHDDLAPAPMLRPILGAFVIHIAAPVLLRNRREGRNDPVIAVRRAHEDWANSFVLCRKVEWSGPTRMVHRPTTPIPGTEGRGVAFVETDAPLLVTIDGGEFVERPPARVLSLSAIAA